MIIAFTGSLDGMSARQVLALAHFLSNAFREISAFHHGDAIGADQQAHKIAVNCRIPVIIHPCDVEHKRAYCTEGDPIILGVKPPIVRNHDMVKTSDLIIAGPTTLQARLRSGTWSTIRYAREMVKPVMILDP